MPSPQLQRLDMPFPSKGLHEASAVSSQPEGTSGRLLNVRGYDLDARRDRGCQRSGASKLIASRKDDTEVDIMVAASLGSTPSAGVDYLRFASDDPDGDYNIGPAFLNGHYVTAEKAYFTVLGGTGVAPTGGGSAAFSPGPAVVAIADGDFSDPNNVLLTHFLTFNGDCVIPGSGTIVWECDASMADMSDGITTHDIKLTFFKDHVACVIRGSGGTQSNNYSYLNTISSPGGTVPVGAHQVTCQMAQNGFVLYVDFVAVLAHTFTAPEEAALGGWTSRVCMAMLYDGGTGYTYDLVQFAADGVSSFDITAEKVIYGQDGETYLGSIADGFTLVDASALTPDTTYTTGEEVSIAAAYGYFWVVDGVISLRRVAVDTGVITQPAATAGSLPALSRLVWLYRGRLFHGRFAADPRNYYASKSGDPLNYDVSDITQNGAFAGNNTQQAGLLGDILTAAIPYGDVSCVMGMASSIAIMRGDPKAGGSLDTVSREIGIVGPTAWARDPDGRLYFMARDGLYTLTTSNPNPEPMSRGRLDETLGSIDFSTYRVRMAWDPAEYGLKIFLVPSSDSDLTYSIFWEKRKDAYWPDAYPAAKGPTAVCTARGAVGAGELVILGSRDGYLRGITAGALTDDSETITSYVDYPAQQFNGDMVNSKIVQSRFLFADNGTNFGCSYFWKLSTDAITAEDADVVGGRTLTLGGYQTLDRTRIRGACGILTLQNTVNARGWAIERTTLMVAPSGRVRV